MTAKNAKTAKAAKAAEPTEAVVDTSADVAEPRERNDSVIETFDTGAKVTKVNLKRITAPSRLASLKEQFVNGNLPAGVRVRNSLGQFEAYEVAKD